ncbi:hypothetical protein AB0I22_32490 [Streptomyces sp. NPDC050610]|uniref:hypothetical protein n=1 Tax=Streptomyces sp. NPDC050610 TaxID=3157097 RepID=UPI0034353863
MTQHTEQDLRAQIREIVISMAPGGGSEYADPELVNGLGYHSLALLELAFALEDEFSLPPIDAQTARAIRRVSDVEQYILDQLNDGAADGSAW